MYPSFHLILCYQDKAPTNIFTLCFFVLARVRLILENLAVAFAPPPGRNLMVVGRCVGGNL